MNMQTNTLKTSAIWYRLIENIMRNYYEIFIITSQAEGLMPSDGRPFGMGKSSMSVFMSYIAWAFYQGKIKIMNGLLVDENTYNEKVELMKFIVKNYLKFSIDEVCETIRTSKLEVIPALIWDDVQQTAPEEQNIPRELRRKIKYLTRVRQRLANLILTAPSISDIAKPLRKNVTWEIIIPQRGVYEVQRYVKKRNFYNPVEDVSRLWYDMSGTFEPLPPEVEELYNTIRDKYLDKVILDEEEEEENKRLKRLKDAKIIITNTDLQIYKLRAEGYSQYKIAQMLGITRNDVNNSLGKLRAIPLFSNYFSRKQHQNNNNGCC